MDRHEIPKDISAEHVASMHQADLKVQHLFGCKGMTYWCDEARRTAFCLIEAPNEKAIQDMHNHAHGDLPHSIIEVNKKIVESFLGRIEDPENVEDELHRSFNDPAFRVIMVIEITNYLNRVEGDQFTIFTQKFHNSASKTIKKFNGSVIKKDNSTYLVSFRSVSDAVLCALKIQFNFKYVTPKHDAFNRRLNIALSGGTPVLPNKELFEDGITLATRMCEFVKDQIVISAEINTLYESENQNARIDKDLIRSLKPSDEKFLTQLIDQTESNWNKTTFNGNTFSKEMGYSKSQLYRKLVKLTGKSPNHFIREFRLHKALLLLHEQRGNISEIAYETGFNSPTYFSKCFFDAYGILPSKYLQQHIH
jgi:AraC-like DNA-binding protein